MRHDSTVALTPPKPPGIARLANPFGKPRRPRRPPKQGWTDWLSETGRGGPGYTGYDGPGVQDYINQGTIGWNPGLGSIGYTKGPSLVPVAGGGGAGGGGGGGDSMISGDWEVQQAEAAMAEQMARARGDFQSGLRTALIDLGIGDTAQLGSLGQYIDKATIQKAVENRYSQTAQIGQQAERSRAMNNAALAARGILSSGQTTKSQQDVSGQAEQSRYSALRDFLGEGAAGLRGLGDLEFQMAQGVAAARSAAAYRAAMAGGFDDEGYGQTDGLFTAPASAGLADVPLFPGMNSNYRRPVRQTRQQFFKRKPKGNYRNYLTAWNRQHPYGF